MVPWAALAVFAALTGVATQPLITSPLAASVAAAVAIEHGLDDADQALA